MVVEAQKFEVGDRISFKMEDGEEVGAIALKQVGGSMLFITTDCLKKEYPMYDRYNGEGYGEYEDSDLRKHLNNEVIAGFPREIRERMATFDNDDYLRLPTEKEIFGMNEYGGEEGADVEQFSVMKKRRHRIAFHGYGTDEWEWYWLKNKARLSDSFFCFAGSYGNSNRNGASFSGGVRPLFLLRNQ